MMSFVRTFIFAVTMICIGALQAGAKAPACTGANLMEKLAREKPEDFKEILADGAREANANALLWRIEKSGTASSYLFGTMHVTDKRLRDVPEEVRNALNGASTVAVENLDVMDTVETQRKLRALAGQMTFHDGTDLRDHLNEGEQSVLREAARKFQLSFSQVIKLKPWMAASLLALPLCEKQRKAAGEPFLDKAIVERARVNNAELVSLETIAEQINAMASLPMSAQVAFLTSSARLAAKSEDFLETMIALYLERKIGAISAMARYFAGDDVTVSDAYEEFHQKLVTKRNQVMLERALPLLQEGKVFIAIGALHLSGEHGLVELFRKAGYTVTPVW